MFYTIENLNRQVQIFILQVLTANLQATYLPSNVNPPFNKTSVAEV